MLQLPVNKLLLFSIKSTDLLSMLVLLLSHNAIHLLSHIPLSNGNSGTLGAGLLHAELEAIFGSSSG